MPNVFSLLIVVLVLFWLFGMGGHYVYAGIPAYDGGYLIHMLLVLAVVLLILKLLGIV